MTAPTPPRTQAGARQTPRPQRQERVKGQQRVSSFARVVRGGLAGALSASLAAASHFAVDRAAPEPVVVGVSVAVAVGVCVLLAGHRMGPVRLGSAVAISQGAYHLLFSLPGGNTVGAATHFPRGSEPAYGRTHAPLGTVPPDPFPVETAHDPMLVLHVLAAVVTYLLLRHGEKAWWALVEVLGTPIRRLLTAVLPWVAARRPLERAGRSFLHDLHDLGCALEIVTPRGPPVAVL